MQEFVVPRSMPRILLMMVGLGEKVELEVLVPFPWLKACQVPPMALEALISRASSVSTPENAKVPNPPKPPQSASKWHNCAGTWHFGALAGLSNRAEEPSAALEAPAEAVSALALRRNPPTFRALFPPRSQTPTAPSPPTGRRKEVVVELLDLQGRRVREQYVRSSFDAVHAYGDTAEDAELLALADESWFRVWP